MVTDAVMTAQPSQDFKPPTIPVRFIISLGRKRSLLVQNKAPCAQVWRTWLLLPIPGFLGRDEATKNQEGT